MHKLVKSILLTVTILASITPIVKAHDVSLEPWFYINEENLSEDNESPNTSSLPWSEHVLSRTFPKNTELTLRADLAALGFESNAVVKWEIDSKNLTGTEVKHKFSNTGNYFIRIEIFENEDLEFEETVMITIGDIVSSSKFNVDGAEVLDENPTRDIKRTQPVNFEVISPNDKFKYEWDLGDKDVREGIKVSKTFESTKLPGYVILRTTDKNTNVFADSFVKLRSDDKPKFVVNTPPVKAPVKENNNTTGIIFLSIGIVSLLGLITLSLFLIVKTKSKK